MTTLHRGRFLVVRLQSGAEKKWITMQSVKCKYNFHKLLVIEHMSDIGSGNDKELTVFAIFL